MPEHSTVLIVGLGDLGQRVLDALSRCPTVDRLVVAARDDVRALEHVGQARLTACLTGGPGKIDFSRVDIDDVEASRAVILRAGADVIVLAAARHTWWRTPAGATQERLAKLASLPYGAWLPANLPLVRRFMEAHRASGSAAPVICLPYPDVIGPALSGIGLAPHLGAGNVMEVATKIAVLGAERYASEPDVRLIMHHAAERIAFAVFAPLGGSLHPHGDPPWLGAVQIVGEKLADVDVEAMVRAPYPLPNGPNLHRLTSAATVNVVAALLSDSPVATHVPAPLGLPGGYPVYLSRSALELRLPHGVTREQAVRVNEEAARWDGIERVDRDGTVHFTAAVSDISEQVLGLRLRDVAPGDQDEIAEELLARAAA